MGESRADPASRLYVWVRRARGAGVVGGVLLVVVLFGTLVELSEPAWSWPPSVLPLLMTGVVLLSVLWAPVEVGRLIVEVLRQRGSGYLQGYADGLAQRTPRLGPVDAENVVPFNGGAS